MKKEIEIYNETLTRYLGLTGPDKCITLASIDGPGAEDINSILKESEVNGTIKDFLYLFDSAYSLVDSHLTNFQEKLNKLVESKLNIQDNLYNTYKVLLEIIQKTGRPNCEIVLITELVEEVIEDNILDGVKVLCFNREGKLLNEALDKPLTVYLDSFVNMIDTFNKEIEKAKQESLNKSSYIISYSCEETDSPKTHTVEHSSNEIYSARISRKNKKDTCKDQPKKENKGSLKISNFTIPTSLNSKTIIAGASVIMLVTTMTHIFAYNSGKKSLEETVNEQHVVIQDAQTQLETYEIMLEELRKNPNADTLVTQITDAKQEITNIKSALAEHGLAYNSEAKSLQAAEDIKTTSSK